MGLFTFRKGDGFRGWTTLQLPGECTTIKISPDAKETKQKVRHSMADMVKTISCL